MYIGRNERRAEDQTLASRATRNLKRSNEEMLKCPMCQQKFSKREIERHASECNGMEEEVVEKETRGTEVRVLYNAGDGVTTKK